MELVSALRFSSGRRLVVVNHHARAERPGVQKAQRGLVRRLGEQGAGRCRAQALFVVYYTALVNVMPLLYRLGASPQRLAGLYGHPR
jgi:hypothetical protein